MKISYFLPKRELTNEELEKLYDSPQWTAAKIFRKTGIKKRFIATDELVSDLAVGAAEKLFAAHDIDRASVDFVLLCTQSPDYFLPTTACIVQNKLGLKKACGALDVSIGCSGFVYGLALANSLLVSGLARGVLLIAGDTLSKYINPFDRSTRIVFGDAASATFLNTEDTDKIGKFVIGSDGSGAPNLLVPAGAMAKRPNEQTSIEATDEDGNVRSKNNLYMNGAEIFTFTLREVPNLVRNTVKENNLTLDDVDYFIFHQANRFLLETLRDELEIEKERFCIDIEEQGNTASATIPIALRRAIDRGDVRAGMKVLLAGFGVGYSWAGTVITI